MPKLCVSCHQHYIDTRCPHCTVSSPTKKLPIAILLGLGLMGCPSKTDDSGNDDPTDTAQDTADPIPEPEDAPMYGVESVE